MLSRPSPAKPLAGHMADKTTALRGLKNELRARVDIYGQAKSWQNGCYPNALGTAGQQPKFGLAITGTNPNTL